MLSNVLYLFSKTSAYFGFLKFEYSNDDDENADDDDKNDRLLPIAHFDLSVALTNLILVV